MLRPKNQVKLKMVKEPINYQKSDLKVVNVDYDTNTVIFNDNTKITFKFNKKSSNYVKCMLDKLKITRSRKKTLLENK